MKKKIYFVAILSTLLAACNKELTMDTPPASEPGYTEYTEPSHHITNDTILVDASRDGGGWWFPQSGQFNPSAYHQGTALVNYLEALGYVVKELPRGATVTRELLRRHQLVIRAGIYGTYTNDEIAAYKEFLERKTALLLISEHSAERQNDQLAAYLGLQFSGSLTVDITQFNAHPITQGVSTHRYIAGSVIQNAKSEKITPVGMISNASVSNAVAMGTVHHSTCRIVFIGDINGLELVPQPLTKNLFKWLVN